MYQSGVGMPTPIFSTHIITRVLKSLVSFFTIIIEQRFLKNILESRCCLFYAIIAEAYFVVHGEEYTVYDRGWYPINFNNLSFYSSYNWFEPVALV